jgi:hypothetical protein
MRGSIQALVAIALGATLASCGGGGGGTSCSGGVTPDPGCSCTYPEKNMNVCTRPLLAVDSMNKPVHSDVVRTECSDVKEFCAPPGGDRTPKLACLTAAHPNEPATPATVTMTGWVSVFSSGPNSDGITIQVYDADILNAAASLDSATPIAQTTVTLDQTSFMNNARFCPDPNSDFGRTDTTCYPQTNDCGTSCPEASQLKGTRFCLNTNCQERLRVELRYEIPNVPTNKFLAVRTTGPGKASDTVWGQLVQYNVYLSTAARACAKPEGTDPNDTECLRPAVGGASARFERNVKVLSKSDYMTIPVTLGTSITPGFGAVAGEVHDCDDVRLENAQVSFDIPPAVRSYSNGNPNHTVFDLGLEDVGTSRLGIFTGINMMPGFVDVEGWGRLNNAKAFLGKYRVKIWPDSVSTMIINGGRPVVP